MVEFKSLLTKPLFRRPFNRECRLKCFCKNQLPTSMLHACRNSRNIARGVYQKGSWDVGWLELRVNNYDPIYFAPDRDVMYLNGHLTGGRFFDHNHCRWRLRQAHQQEHWNPKVKYLALRCHAAVEVYPGPGQALLGGGLIFSQYLFKFLKDMKDLKILFIVRLEKYVYEWPKETWQHRFKKSYARECGVPCK